MSTPDGDTPTATTSWWENVSLEDVAGSMTVVEDFINRDSRRVDEGQFLKALPLMIMCGGDDPPWLGVHIARRTDDVLKAARGTSEVQKANSILQDQMQQLKVLGDALKHLPDSFKRDPKDSRAEYYRDDSVARVYEAVPSGIARCHQAILARFARIQLRNNRSLSRDL